MCQDWMSIPGWTADIVQTEGNSRFSQSYSDLRFLQRPMSYLNLKLSSSSAGLLSTSISSYPFQLCISCRTKGFYIPLISKIFNIIIRCQEISKLHLESVVEGKEKNYLQKPKLLPKLNCIFCPKSQKESTKVYAEIRPLVRLYRKSSPSPTRQSKPEVEPFNWRKYVQNESKRPNIKFSTSTALYSPPKPSYDNIFRSDAFQSNIKENYSGKIKK